MQSDVEGRGGSTVAGPVMEQEGRREHLFEAVSEALRELLRPGPSEAALPHALRIIGQAVAADRVLLFRTSAFANTAPADAGAPGPAAPWISWVDAGSESDRGLDRAVAGCGTEAWRQRLHGNEVVRAHTDDVEDGASPEMEEPNTALLLLPVFGEDACNGVLRLEARGRSTWPEEGWSDRVVEALQLFASGLGSVVEGTKPPILFEKPPALPPPLTGDGGGLPKHRMRARAIYQMAEAIVAVDERGRVTLFNEAAEALFGLSAADVVGGAVERVLSQVVSEQDQEAVRTMLGAQDVRSVETAIQASSGDTRQVSIAIAPLQPSMGQIGAVAIVRDVTADQQQKARLEHRARMDRALLEVSQLLVATTDFKADELLRIVGKAMQADYAYLVVVPPESHAGWQEKGGAGSGAITPIPPRAFLDIMDDWSGRLDTYTLYEWHGPHGPEQAASPARGSEEDLAAFAVPMLSSKDLLYGYLGIEYDQDAPAWIDENARALNVLGDLISAYLERKVAASALRESEERYRQFVETISEGIWCIEMEAPVSTTLPKEEQVEALRQRAIITEFNEGMARALQITSPAEALGKKAAELEEVPQAFDRGFFADLIEHDYRLRNQEYSLRHEPGGTKHFVANAIGTVEEGHLMRVWGSWTDVTDRVSLEERMVTALEQQQQRMGRELHDGVGQWLTSVRMLSQNLAERYFSENEPGHEQIQRVISYTQRASEMARELQRGLSSVQAQEGGLPEALEDLALSIDQLPDVKATFEREGPCEVDDTEMKLQLYRVAQEAANNALKHAAPSHIHIRLAQDESALELVVTDDGVGFDLEAATGKSLGLHSMRYRAGAIDADLSIDSRAGQGTMVRCTLPMEGRESLLDA